MKRLKCLIIDDDVNLSHIFSVKLRAFGHTVDVRDTPDDGIEFAKKNKNFDVIFIDFRFANSKTQNGADIGKAIRKELPMSALILMTAWGNEEKENYVSVGWDAFYSKYNEGNGADLDKMLENFERTIDKALANVAERCPSEFSEADLTKLSKYLTALNDTIIFFEDNKLDVYIVDYLVTAGAELLLQDRPIDVSILRKLKTGTTKEQKEEQKKIREENKMTTYSNFSSHHFKLSKNNGVYNKQALKVRHLLSMNREKWLKLRKIKSGVTPYYSPVYSIVQEFDLY
jgi:CheY-like chemotaxis protein